MWRRAVSALVQVARGQDAFSRPQVRQDRGPGVSRPVLSGPDAYRPTERALRVPTPTRDSAWASALRTGDCVLVSPFHQTRTRAFLLTFIFPLILSIIFLKKGVFVAFLAGGLTRASHLSDALGLSPGFPPRLCGLITGPEHSDHWPLLSRPLPCTVSRDSHFPAFGFMQGCY